MRTLALSEFRQVYVGVNMGGTPSIQTQLLVQLEVRELGPSKVVEQDLLV